MQLLFDLFASIALIASGMVIVSKNPIHSVIFLILVFCNATGLLLLLKAQFIAFMFLIIYVGAIAVLFLFVVMMLNIKLNELGWRSGNRARSRAALPLFERAEGAPVGGVMSFIFFILTGSFFLGCTLGDHAAFPDRGPEPGDLTLGLESHAALGPSSLVKAQGDAFFRSETSAGAPWASLVVTATGSAVRPLGSLIYTYYFYYLIAAGFILLVAMIGAIVLTEAAPPRAHRPRFKQVASPGPREARPL